MAGESIAVMMFLLTINIGLFALPFITDFSKNKFVDLILKRSCWVISIYLFMLNSAITMTIASIGAIGIQRELTQYMWLLGMFGYVFMGYVALLTLYEVVKMWDFTKKQKRMGEDED